MRSLRCHWSWWALLVGLVAAVLSTLAPYGAPGASSYLLVALLGVGLSFAGARRAAGLRRRAWTLVALGQLAFLTGDVLWVVYDHVLGITPTSSVADIFYLSRYALVAAGLVTLVRARWRGRDRATLLDAGIMSSGFGVPAMVFLVLPAASGQPSFLQQLLAGAYPVADLLVLAVLLGLLTSGVSLRRPSPWALVGALIVMFVVDVLHTLSTTAGLSYPARLDGGWLVTYLLIGFAAAHPSSVLDEPMPARTQRITSTRIVVLGGALMLAPVTDEVVHVTGYGQSAHVVVLGALVGVALVLLRLWDVMTNLERQAVELAASARVDGLTGVPNRRTWDRELSRACTAARDTGQPLVVAILDLDHFKAFNDAHGHLSGDLVLKDTAAAWEAILDGGGVLARYGGEEFTVLLPDHRLDVAEPLLERLRAAVPGRQTCSIGVAVWDFSEPPAEVVARADQALYHAKRAGRDRVAVHDGATTRELSGPRGAGVESLLSTVFQPIVHLATGQPAAFEALSRFSNGNPQDVFTSAGLHGAKVSLEAAAVRSARAGWRGTLPLSLNLNGATIGTPEVEAALQGDLSHVILELTESDSASSTPAALAAVADLRARGARIAVDDFGVGFSNVERVALLDPDLLKLDMSLVRGIDRNPMLQAVVRGCLAYVEQTGALVCAEGIETAAELETLVGLGVHLGQGYLLGRPEVYEYYEGCTDPGTDPLTDQAPDVFRPTRAVASRVG